MCNASDDGRYKEGSERHSDQGGWCATTPDEVHEVVKGYPNTDLNRGKEIFKFILDNPIYSVLECGFNHGVSTCYIAAALAAKGEGHLVTIDRAQTVAYEPGLEHFLSLLGLSDFVIPFYEHTTFNWRLSRFLRMSDSPVFDFVFLDAGHTWEPTALGFLISEKLTNPGGYILVDDINWSLQKSMADVDWVRQMPEDERTTPQVREVVELLIRPHPEVSEWTEDKKWGYAQKKGGARSIPEDGIWESISIQAEKVREDARRSFPVSITIPPDVNTTEWRNLIREGIRKNTDVRKSKKL